MSSCVSCITKPCKLGVTRSHGPSPHPTASRYQTYSFTTVTGCNKAKGRFEVSDGWRSNQVRVVLLSGEVICAFVLAPLGNPETITNPHPINTHSNLAILFSAANSY